MKSLFKRVLIANRGEIAVRIAKACRKLGIQSVGIFSQEDRKSLHTKFCDEAYLIGPAESRLSYLHMEKIIQLAKDKQIDAIHPGYGFLSENAEFARRLKAAGLCFIGPDVEHIEEMGDKVQARNKMKSLGVPIVPGTTGHHSISDLLQEVRDLLNSQPDFQFPLLVKAAGGGGGKGMRKVEDESKLEEALERAQSESEKAFGNSLIFVERYIEQPRHIEVQVLGDGETAVHLYERECSLQRRHQKVIEEAPSPSLSDSARKKMLEISARAAQEMKYKSAGTMEFIVSPEDDFYFLEMNTRIQVEHPVTECITGVDLVAEQIKIAAGEKLSRTQDSIQVCGHAIEARIYAEDAENNFTPSPGRLEELSFYRSEHIRVDTGIEEPGLISSFYDPMIAKLIAFGETREIALSHLRRALNQSRFEGCITNRAFLSAVAESSFFDEGRYHTHLLEQHEWRRSPQLEARQVAALCLHDHLRSGGRLSDRTEALSAWQLGEPS